MELKIKIKSSLPENFETAKNAPTGKLKIQENKSAKDETFKDNRIISSKSVFNKKIRLIEFSNISVNSVI